MVNEPKSEGISSDLDSHLSTVANKITYIEVEQAFLSSAKRQQTGPTPIENNKLKVKEKALKQLAKSSRDLLHPIVEIWKAQQYVIQGLLVEWDSETELLKSVRAISSVRNAIGENVDSDIKALGLTNANEIRKLNKTIGAVVKTYNKSNIDLTAKAQKRDPVQYAKDNYKLARHNLANTIVEIANKSDNAAKASLAYISKQEEVSKMPKADAKAAKKELKQLKKVAKKAHKEMNKAIKAQRKAMKNVYKKKQKLNKVSKKYRITATETAAIETVATEAAATEAAATEAAATEAAATEAAATEAAPPTVPEAIAPVSAVAGAGASRLSSGNASRHVRTINSAGSVTSQQDEEKAQSKLQITIAAGISNMSYADHLKNTLQKNKPDGLEIEVTSTRAGHHIYITLESRVNTDEAVSHLSGIIERFAEKEDLEVKTEVTLTGESSETNNKLESIRDGVKDSIKNNENIDILDSDAGARLTMG